MGRKLQYIVPPIISYLRHSYPLGIMMTCTNADANLKDWMTSNYIALCWPETTRYALFDMMVSYNDNPFVKLRTISRGELNYILKYISFENVIKNLIDMEIYVQVNNDDYYLSTSRSFQKEHHLHQILIIGYEETRNEFICWGFYKGIYQEISVPTEEIVPYDAELIYGTDSIMLLYSSRYAGFELNIDAVMSQVKDYINSKNIALEIAHMGCFDQYIKARFGMDCYKCIYDEINSQNQKDYFDHRFLCVLSEHKKMMYNRMLYLKKKGENNITENDLLLLNQAYKYSGIAINNVLKLNKSYEKEKKANYYYRILESIKKVEENEYNALASIISKYGEG